MVKILSLPLIFIWKAIRKIAGLECCLEDQIGWIGNQRYEEERKKIPLF